MQTGISSRTDLDYKSCPCGGWGTAIFYCAIHPPVYFTLTVALVNEDHACCVLEAGSSHDSGQWFTHWHFMVKEMLLRRCKIVLNRWWKILPYIHTHTYMYVQQLQQSHYNYVVQLMLTATASLLVFWILNTYEQRLWNSKLAVYPCTDFSSNYFLFIKLFRQDVCSSALQYAQRNVLSSLDYPVKSEIFSSFRKFQCF